MADFTNIDGVYAKDTELRSGIDTLRTTVLSNTIKPLTVTKNGTYTAIPSSGTYGYSPITVDVQEEPWTPLEDGYSNFWFELTNDTLSPWLNFSAKNAGAVIDWGDGSGEVALDTLTPTHTYSKAGKYVVKVKGVTGIDRQYNTNMGTYVSTIKAVELNSDVTTLSDIAFRFSSLKHVALSNNLTSIGNFSFAYCADLESVTIPNNVTSIGNNAFTTCTALKNIELPTALTLIEQSIFNTCVALSTITIPSTVTSIGNTAFSTCMSLSEIHMQPTVPPTLGSNVFNALPSNFIIYVPIGYGETYKSAWSTYSSRILEEGQSLSKSQLRAIAEEQKNNGEEMR